jgi:hypothetical protein
MGKFPIMANFNSRTGFQHWEKRIDALRPVIGIPLLGGDEQVFARNPSGGRACLQGPAYFTLVLYRVPHNRTVEIQLPSLPWSALLVAAGSAIMVPNPSAGIWRLKWLSGILLVRKSEDSVMCHLGSILRPARRLHFGLM